LTNFVFAEATQISVVSAFPDFIKVKQFAASIERSKAENVSSFF